MTVTARDEHPSPKTKQFQNLLKRVKQGGVRALSDPDRLVISEMVRRRFTSTHPPEVENLKACLQAFHIAVLEHTLTLTADR